MLLRTLLSQVKFYLKYVLLYGYSGFVCLILLPYFFLHPKDIFNQLLYSKFAIPMIPLIGLEYEIRGQKHLAEDRACIIVSNHQSAIDTVGMASATPILKKYVAVAKKSLFYGWPIGLAFWFIGYIFIDKNNWEKTSGILDEAAKAAKENKVKIWIFPEGSRYHEGGIHEFRKGAFYMAIKHQLPILPVIFSEYYFLSLKEKRFDSGKIIMTGLPAISTEGLEMKDLPELMTRTRLLMIESFDSMNKELEKSLNKSRRRTS